jgi:F1F0 ATPase subunit 2
MMGHAVILALAFLGGILLGGLFFGGLWWTVQRGIRSAVAALWFSASSLLRTALILAGFYVVSHGDWLRLLACLLGFIAARVALVRLSLPPVIPSKPSTP